MAQGIGVRFSASGVRVLKLGKSDDGIKIEAVAAGQPGETFQSFLDNTQIAVDDTAVAVMRFKSGAIGQILVSNSQKPGFYGKIHIHGSNGASIGAQTEGGSPFVAGVTSTVDPPFNDIWTVPGEGENLKAWNEADWKTVTEIDPMTYYHKLQIKDFLLAVIEDREPSVPGIEARKAVELFTAIYLTQKNGLPVKFPVKYNKKTTDYDGRYAYTPYSHRVIETK